jgi:phenylacetate-CoA ligase
MPQHFDSRETRDPRQRELDLMGHLPGLVANALKAPGWRQHLGAIDPAEIATRAALARLPVLRKSELPARQKAAPPFGGRPGRAIRTALHLARPDLRARRTP